MNPALPGSYCCLRQLPGPYKPAEESVPFADSWIRQSAAAPSASCTQLVPPTSTVTGLGGNATCAYQTTDSTMASLCEKTPLERTVSFSMCQMAMYL